MNPDKFNGSLLLEAIPHWMLATSVQLYRLMEDFTFLSDEFGAITAPKGFISDFASVPAITRFYTDKDDSDILYASIPHDFLYARKGKLDNRTLTRYQADCVLREAMQALGAPPFKTAMVFAAVRVGGGRWTN